MKSIQPRATEAAGHKREKTLILYIIMEFDIAHTQRLC